MVVPRKKVRKGQVYRVRMNLFDEIMCPEHHSVTNGQLVRVIQLPSAPPPNTMGQCHVEDAETGEFLGMVTTNSLEDV